MQENQAYRDMEERHKKTRSKLNKLWSDRSVKFQKELKRYNQQLKRRQKELIALIEVKPTKENLAELKRINLILKEQEQQQKLI